MITLRKSDERGHADHGWLNSHFSFSFADYHDPKHMEFRSLRVINEDVVQPGQGFPTHPHRNMEIFTYIVSGALEHKDSTGHGGVIRRGDLQCMSAGSGILHSEFNPSDTEPAHLLQIWIQPEKQGLSPRYEQKRVDLDPQCGPLILLVSRQAENDSLMVFQDIKIYSGLLKAGASFSYKISPSRALWLQMVRGRLKLDQHLLQAGDGAAIEALDKIEGHASETVEFLLFDLA